MIVSSVETTNPLAETSSAQISIRNVSMVYRGRRGWLNRLTRRTSKDYIALEDINFDIAPNTFVSIIGPSGCGKSTLLNLIAGLTSPSSGCVEIDGETVYAPGPDRGVVFQNYALMPWLTVAENLHFARAEQCERIRQGYLADNRHRVAPTIPARRRSRRDSCHAPILPTTE